MTNRPVTRKDIDASIREEWIEAWRYLVDVLELSSTDWMNCQVSAVNASERISNILAVAALGLDKNSFERWAYIKQKIGEIKIALQVIASDPSLNSSSASSKNSVNRIWMELGPTGLLINELFPDPGTIVKGVSALALERDAEENFSDAITRLVGFLPAFEKMDAVTKAESELKALVDASPTIDYSEWTLVDLATKLRRGKKTVGQTPTYRKWQSQKSERKKQKQ